jgi:hypothetical protein
VSIIYSSANKGFLVLLSYTVISTVVNKDSCNMWSQNNQFYYDIAAVEETDVLSPGTSGELQQVLAAASTHGRGGSAWQLIGCPRK